VVGVCKHGEVTEYFTHLRTKTRAPTLTSTLFFPILFLKFQQLKPTAPTQAHSLQVMAFEQRFPTHSFPTHSFFRVLGSFGAGKSLQTLLEDLNEVRGDWGGRWDEKGNIP